MKNITRTLMAVLAIGLSIFTMQAENSWDSPVSKLKGAEIQPDTDYFLYNLGTRSFLTSGGDYWTQAIVAEKEKARPVTLRAGQGEGRFTLEFEGNQRTLFRVAGGYVYTDNSYDNNWIIRKADSEKKIYTLQCPEDEQYYQSDEYLGTTSAPYLANTGRWVYDVRYNRTDDNGEIYWHWLFVTIEEADKYEARIRLDKLMEIASTTTTIDLSSYIVVYNNGDFSALQTAGIDLLAKMAAETNVSEENPMDVTDLYLINPSFETGDFTGWVNSNMEVLDNGAFPLAEGKQENPWYAQAYKWGGPLVGIVQIQQQLKGIANGKYTLKAAATAGDAEYGASLYAGKKETIVDVTEEYAVEDIIVVDGTLTIGFKFLSRTSWIAVDNFRLEYLGYDFDGVKEILSGLLDKAILLEGEYMSNATSRELSTAIEEATNAYEATIPSADDLSEATVRLENAIAAAEISVAKYIELETILNAAITAYDESKKGAAEFKSVIDQVQAIYDGKELDGEELLATVQELDQAILHYNMKNATEEAPLDVTRWMIINPGFETGNFTGWENRGMQTQSNNSFGSKVGVHYVEKWDGTLINGEFEVKQELTGLPVGKYLLKAVAFAESYELGGPIDGAVLFAGEATTTVSEEQYYEVNNITVTDGTLSIGFRFINGTSTNWIGVDDFTLWYLGTNPMEVNNDNGHITLSGMWSEEDFKLIDNESITSYDVTQLVGLNAKPATKNPNCLFFVDEVSSISGQDNVITAENAKKITLVDGYSYAAIREFIAEEVTFTRDFTGMNGWATLYIPFPAELDGNTVEYFSSYDKENSRIYFEGASSIEANTPYLLKVQEGTASKTFAANGTVNFSESLNPITPEGSNFTFQGTYTTIPAGKEKLILKADGSEFAVTSLSPVAPFRAYLTANDDNYPLKSISVIHDGDDITTIATDAVEVEMRVWGENGILHIFSVTDQTLYVYSITGSLIGKVEVTTGYNAINGLSQGIYVINNQKVVIK